MIREAEATSIINTEVEKDYIKVAFCIGDICMCCDAIHPDERDSLKPTVKEYVLLSSAVRMLQTSLLNGGAAMVVRIG